MRKLRAALLGMFVAVPAALALPGPLAATASATTCPFTVSINQPFNVSVSPLTNSSTSTVTITGSNFPNAGLTNFGSGWAVYFPDVNGNQTIRVTNATLSPDGTQLTFTVPPNAYSGQLEVCVATDSYEAFTQKFSYVPVITSIPASAPENSQVTIVGRFMPGQPTWVSWGSCGGSYQATATRTSVAGSPQTVVQATVPGYCPGQIVVTQTGYDGSTLVSKPSAGFLAITPVGSLGTTSSYPGQSATVTGSGFGPSGQVSVGGTPASVTSWSDTQIVFKAPDGTEGGPVAISAPGGAANAGNLSLVPHISGISPTSAKDGQVVSITGVDFGSSPGGVTLDGQALQGSDIASWSMDQVKFTVPGGAQPGQVGVIAGWPDQPSTTGPNLNLVPTISSVSPTSAAPGAYVTVGGSTFGQQAGSVTIGGKAAQILDWADTAIIATVPSGATTGKLVVTSGYGQSIAWGQTFTVLAGSAASGGQSSGGYSSYTNSGTLNVKPNYGFLPLPKPPPGVAFHVTAPSDTVKPGSAVDLTVNLALLGKPVAGATITFQIEQSPGSDTSLSAPSALTDQNGLAHVTLHTSKKPGQTIVIAHSGAFADQIRIVTLSPVAALGPTTILRTSTLDPHILYPFIGLLALAVLLLLGTVILQFVLHRRSRLHAVPVPAAAATADAVAAVDRDMVSTPRPAPEPGRAAAEVPAKPKRAPRPRKPRLPKPSAEAAGADDALTGPVEIAPVIPLHPAGSPAAGELKITRTRGRAKVKKAQ